MKHILLLISFLLITLSLHSQKDTVSVVRNFPQKTFVRETPVSNITIYPVPVRDNSFTIRADRNMVSVKVTNMIGQDIFRTQYSDPVSMTKVVLTKPARGMYLVTLAFADGSRIVRKVMIESPE
jgi:Secretion system C-terminal sorting domain